MQHCLKSRRFCVRVPVLSLSRYPTWPSSSFSEVFLACAGLSAGCQYISVSQPMNRLWTEWITSNLWTHTYIHTHAHTQVRFRPTLFPQMGVQCCRRHSRDVESNGHGRAEQDDVAPEDEEPGVAGVAVNHQRGKSPRVAHDPTREHASADGEEQSCEQHAQDDLQIHTHTHTHTVGELPRARRPPALHPTHPGHHSVEHFLRSSPLHSQFPAVLHDLGVGAWYRADSD